MFPCSASAGCGTGCGTGYASSTDPIRYGVPNDRQSPGYVPPPVVMPPTVPQPVSPGTTAGPVMMPPRGMQGSAVQPTWQGRVVPESAVSTKPAPAPAVGPIVPTGFKYPAPAQK
jgi:hypothetical protein